MARSGESHDDFMTRGCPQDNGIMNMSWLCILRRCTHFRFVALAEVMCMVLVGMVCCKSANGTILPAFVVPRNDTLSTPSFSLKNC